MSGEGEKGKGQKKVEKQVYAEELSFVDGERSERPM